MPTRPSQLAVRVSFFVNLHVPSPASPRDILLFAAGVMRLQKLGIEPESFGSGHARRQLETVRVLVRGGPGATPAARLHN